MSDDGARHADPTRSGSVGPDDHAVGDKVVGDGAMGDGPGDGVVEVPETVRREVDQLLSDDATTKSIDLPAADPTPRSGIEPATVDPGAGLTWVEDSPAADVVIVDRDDPGVPDRTVGTERATGAIAVEVAVIGNDDDGVVVIGADEMDRVVIVDDDNPDPRFEERRRRNERRERLKKLRWVRLGAGVSAAVVAVLAVLASPLFAVRSVSIEGAVYTSSATLDEVSAFLKGESVFSMDRERAESIVGRDPWVAEVRVSTNFPSSALVEIRERQPVVWYVGSDNKARVVDLEGHVVAVLDGWPTQYLPVGGVGPDLEAGARADDVYRAVAQLVSALPDELSGKVRESGVTAGGEVFLVLRSGTVVRFGRPVDLQNKLVSVVVLLRRLDPADLVSIDVSTGEASYLAR
jgi:cell division protein FtsQ